MANIIKAQQYCFWNLFHDLYETQGGGQGKVDSEDDSAGKKIGNQWLG